MIGRKQPPVSESKTVEPKGFDAYELRLGDVMRGERATMGKSLLDVQRELKIKASYIAAIENTDPTAFDTPGFIAGYVRSYARYLGLDPEWAYETFCREGNFTTVHGMDKAASAKRPAERKTRTPGSDPLVEPNVAFVPEGQGLLSRIEPGAIGSVMVLMVLIGALGFGGWTVLNQIQQVKLSPVEQAPLALAEVDPLATPEPFAAPADQQAAAVSAAALERLYQPRPLDVPQLIARDGPISTLEPGALGALAALSDRVPTMGADTTPAPSAAPDLTAPVVATTAPEMVLFATRPAWVRVTAADGAVLFEKILDAGEQYVLPKTDAPPLLRTGYAGAVYLAVNGVAHGPVGEGAQVVKNIALAPEPVTQTYALADLTGHPEVAEMVAQLTQPVAPEAE